MTDKQNELPDGPLFVTTNKTKVMCCTSEGWCRHYGTGEIPRVGEAAACFLRAGLSWGKRYIPSTNEMPSWCPRAPTLTPPDRRTVRPVPTAERKADIWEQLIACANVSNELEKKTDVELADLLCNHVWADMSILSTQSALIEVVIERLRQSTT